MKKLLLVLLMAATVAGAAGCDSAERDGAAPRTPASAAPTGGDPSAPAPQVVPTPEPEQITLTAGRAVVAGVRSDVVRFKDRIVYRFEGDDHDPSKVNCTADCLIVWPPLLTDGTKIELSGVDPKLVGTVTREDGFTQVTLAGWPLYLFKSDRTADDTLGEGVGGNWSVIRPDGKPAIKK
ncbi:COG4315 family predicted lipoprotein [Micromonospora auratinigra]|uniref:Predicted lipoprotein with conserved Yx(FWY)xxD motif n=1 Tax=Micromonospora auratinigra TaxID=261654 RepID=A0A1A8Z4L4_9ACTN|nr:hypothetical protein [Micromonospora auratinigra]SBT38790.1 Predicted lipoprotein with conserved Yx(FWY)xxD motif [Micromonospora auratinigra]